MSTRARQLHLYYHNERSRWWADCPELPGFRPAATSLRELRRSICTQLQARCSEPVEILQEDICDPVLCEEIEKPRHVGNLTAADGRGLVADAAGNAVRIAIEMDGDRIAAVAFRAFGDPVLTACASFMMDSLPGHTLRFASRLRQAAVVHVLCLQEEKAWCAALVLEALRAAIKDAYPGTARPEPHDDLGGASRGHRGPARRTTPTRHDLALLRPGETFDDLLRERSEIVGAIETLGLLNETGTSAQHVAMDKDVWVACEKLLPHRASLKRAIPYLSLVDHQLILLLGLEGFTEEEAGQVMGITQQAVNKRLWAVALRVQKIWRRGKTQVIRRGTVRRAPPASTHGRAK